MAKDFLTGTGCVVQVKGNSKSGAFKIDKWPTGKISNGLITIDDIQPTEQDISYPVVAVDDHRAIYKFGKNFGQIVVRGTIYLGSNTEKSSKVIQRANQAFQKLRLASTSKPVNVSITSGYKCKAYFTSMAFGQADPNLNRVAYILSGVIAPN